MKIVVWQLVLLNCVFGTMVTADDDWIHEVRKLQAGQFMQACNQAFMNDMSHDSYLMSDFAADVTKFCSEFSVERSSCPNNGFKGLQVDFQDAFFRHASQHMGSNLSRFPVSALMSIGDTGYIISDKTMIELDAMKNDLCVQMQTAFGGEFRITILLSGCVQ
jgi:hypothetical protein